MSENETSRLEDEENNVDKMIYLLSKFEGVILSSLRLKNTNLCFFCVRLFF